ncbi:rhodanese-like domain-containing protein [Myxococcus sp. Y35]|uniref:rhodanese-like domain-containing protein n=1 Tax=Pseudomyxococcus flavus TaxID=3115648 RepID=UPI003CF91249
MPPLFDDDTPHPAGYRDVDVRQLAAASRDSLTVLDVREPAELDGILGRIADVRLAPLATVQDVVSTWPRQTQVVLVCRSGARSARAAVQLVALGFSRVMNLRGGMLAWNTEQLPVVRTHPAPLPTLAAVRDRLFQGLHLLLSSEPPGRDVPAMQDARDAAAAPRPSIPSALLETSAAASAAVQDARAATAAPHASRPAAQDSRDVTAVPRAPISGALLASGAVTSTVHPDSLRAGICPSRLALSAVLDALQAARPPAIQDTAAFEHLLRSLRDQLAVALPEGTC